MEAVKATAAFRTDAGKIKFPDPSKLASRMDCLKDVGNNTFEITAPIWIKLGEEFEHEGAISKVNRQFVDDVENVRQQKRRGRPPKQPQPDTSSAGVPKLDTD